MRETTRAVRSGLTARQPGEPLHAGPVFVSTFHSPEAAEPAEYIYGGTANPSWTRLEHALAELEVGDGEEPAAARIFASGQAALSAVFAATLKPGDTVVLPEAVYFGTRQIVEEVYVPLGVVLRIVESTQLPRPEALAGSRLVWVETPSNPKMEITDLAAVAEAAHAAGALVAADNTTATPLGQRPLRLGADFSVCSDSKLLTGHSDVILGHVAVRDAGLLAQLTRHRSTSGVTPGPMEAWLTLRSLATLPLRLERSSANALALAEFLTSRPEVRDVRYPGLPGHAQSVLARCQMRSFGPLLGFNLADEATARRFLAQCRLVTEATSFGGAVTTAERRARWGRDAVEPGFIRLSAGLEDARDLIEDLAQALDASR